MQISKNEIKIDLSQLSDLCLKELKVVLMLHQRFEEAQVIYNYIASREVLREKTLNK